MMEDKITILYYFLIRKILRPIYNFIINSKKIICYSVKYLFNTISGSILSIILLTIAGIFIFPLMANPPTAGKVMLVVPFIVLITGRILHLIMHLLDYGLKGLINNEPKWILNFFREIKKTKEKVIIDIVKTNEEEKKKRKERELKKNKINSRCEILDL